MGELLSEAPQQSGRQCFSAAHNANQVGNIRYIRMLKKDL
jgi:hypothetical protein